MLEQIVEVQLRNTIKENSVDTEWIDTEGEAMNTDMQPVFYRQLDQQNSGIIDWIIDLW